MGLGAAEGVREHKGGGDGVVQIVSELDKEGVSVIILPTNIGIAVAYRPLGV